MAPNHTDAQCTAPTNPESKAQTYEEITAFLSWLKKVRTLNSNVPILLSTNLKYTVNAKTIEADLRLSTGGLSEHGLTFPTEVCGCGFYPTVYSVEIQDAQQQKSGVIITPIFEKAKQNSERSALISGDATYNVKVAKTDPAINMLAELANSTLSAEEDVTVTIISFAQHFSFTLTAEEVAHVNMQRSDGGK